MRTLIYTLFIMIIVSCGSDDNTIRGKSAEFYAAGAGYSPLLLFHGGGGGAPRFAKDMSTARDELVKHGFPNDHIYQLTYPDQKDISEIVAALEPQIRAILARYDGNTKINLIGHSLGHVVALLTITNLGLLDRVERLIGIAGVMFGQTGPAPGLCRFPVLAPYYCGDFIQDLSGTTQPKLILDLLKDHRQEMNSIVTCSLFSPDDGILDPVDSGAFPDGINISIPHVSHLQFKSKSIVFKTMKESCFADRN